MFPFEKSMLAKFFIVAACVLILAEPGEARHKSCGAASCPLNLHHSLSAGFLRLTLSHEYIDQDRIYVGSSPSFVGAIPGHHDEVETLNERNVLQLHAGLSDRLAALVEVPFIHREHSHIDHTGGGAAWESWNFSGLGDVVVSGEYAILAGDSDASLSIGAGVKTSTGITGAVNAEGEEAEVTIQPGTGSIDGIFRLNFSMDAASVPALGGVYTSLPLNASIAFQLAGKGKDDYRFGNTFLVHAGTAYGFSQAADLLLQANMRIQGHADPGLTGEPRENTGGTWL